MIFFLKCFRHYLLSGPFVLYSDHQTLCASFNKIDIHGRLAWLFNLMAVYNFEIYHLSGDRNFIADYLSQIIGASSRDDAVDDTQIDILWAGSAEEGKCLV